MNSVSATQAVPSRLQSIWFAMLGIILVLSGIFALLAPLASTLAFTLIFGIATVIAGIAEVIHAFGTKSWGGFFINLLLGLAYAGFGVLFLMNPFAGAIALSMVIAVFLVAVGIGEMVLGIRVRGEPGWFWLVLSGLFALGFGIWLLLGIPAAGIFMSGILLGFALIFQGLSFIALAGSSRSSRTSEPGAGNAEAAA